MIAPYRHPIFSGVNFLFRQFYLTLHSTAIITFGDGALYNYTCAPQSLTAWIYLKSLTNEADTICPDSLVIENLKPIYGFRNLTMEPVALYRREHTSLSGLAGDGETPYNPYYVSYDESPVIQAVTSDGSRLRADIVIDGEVSTLTGDGSIQLPA